MSTKIYNGFQIVTHYPEDRSFASMLSFQKTLQQRMRIEVEELYIKLVAEKFTYAFDRGKPKSLRDIRFDIFERQCIIRNKGHRDPEVDFEFNFVLFKHMSEIYGIYYTEQETLAKILKSNPYVRDFAYWNNTDAPDNVTDEEWNHRKEVWDSILRDTGIPCLAGASFDVITNGTTELYVKDTKEKILKAIPSKEKRMYDLAHDLYVTELDKKKYESPSQCMNEYIEGKSIAIPRIIKEQKQDLENKIEEITLETLSWTNK